jgi:hypothetical protein
VQAKPKYVQCNGLNKSVPLHPIVGRHDLQSVTSLRESPSVADHSVADHSTPRRAVTAVIIFFAAHIALLVGVTTPEKFISMKCIVCRPHGKCLSLSCRRRCNPMHPPLARQLMARSIRTFGDAPLGWRYPSVLERGKHHGPSRRQPTWTVITSTLKSACRTPVGGRRCNCQFDAVLLSMLTT